MSEFEYELAYKKGYEQGKKDALRQGSWIKIGGGYFMCSKCRYLLTETENFCPHCGAKM